MILLFRGYQIFVFILGVFFALKDYLGLKKEEPWNYFGLSKWIFYFGAFVGFSLSFGVIAELEYMVQLSTPNIESVLIVILFSLTILCSSIFMVLQKTWCIKYNKTELIFRNSFGYIKKYPIIEIHIIHKKRMTELWFDNIKITQWDSLLVSWAEEISLEKFLNQTKKVQLGHQQRSKTTKKSKKM